MELAKKHRSHAKISRLVFIAEQDARLRAEIWPVLIEEVQKGLNIELYENVVKQFSQWLPEVKVDTKWANSMTQVMASRFEKLESELNVHKKNMDRSKIRGVLLELGNFLFERGDVGGAIQRFLDADEHVSSSDEQLENHVFLCKVHFQTRSMDQLKFHATHALKLANVDQNPHTHGFLTACLGVCSLRAGAFGQAASYFRSVHPALGQRFSDAIILEDVALYVSLCSLVSCSRAQLLSEVLDNAQMRALLELAPEINTVVRDFYNCKYASCLKQLQKLHESLRLDIFLSPYITRMIQSISDDAFAQYFRPFSSVDMNQMASAFEIPVSSLEQALTDLIQSNKIQARIDKHRKILFSKQADERSLAYQRVLRTCNNVMRDARAMQLHVAMLEAGMALDDPTRSAASSSSHSSGLSSRRPNRSDA